jgi:hypothetical protein
LYIDEAVAFEAFSSLLAHPEKIGLIIYQHFKINAIILQLSNRKESYHRELTEHRASDRLEAAEQIAYSLLKLRAHYMECKRLKLAEARDSCLAIGSLEETLE